MQEELGMNQGCNAVFRFHTACAIHKEHFHHHYMGLSALYKADGYF